jgi:hypothetical protein
VDVAGRRSGAAPVRGGRRSLRGWAAQGHRRRRSHGHRRPGFRDRRRRLRGAVAARRAVPDDSHRGRVLGDARPSGVDRGSGRDRGRRRRSRGDGRPERRARRPRAVRSPRHSPDCGAERIRGSPFAAPRAARARAASRRADASCLACPNGFGCGACEPSACDSLSRARNQRLGPGPESPAGTSCPAPLTSRAANWRPHGNQGRVVERSAWHGPADAFANVEKPGSGLSVAVAEASHGVVRDFAYRSGAGSDRARVDSADPCAECAAGGQARGVCRRAASSASAPRCPRACRACARGPWSHAEAGGGCAGHGAVCPGAPP